MRVLLASIVLAGLITPTALADRGKPGSVLIFPVHKAGGVFTMISVTNTNLMPETPISFGGSTNLHFEYANTVPDPQNDFCPQDCIIIDRVEFLTPADTMTVAAACHNALNEDGYLVVSAEDPSLFSTPWSHNYLIGSETVVNPTGSIYSIDAIPLLAVGAAGSATDLDGDHQLDFDGLEYEELPDILMIDSFLPAGNPFLTLINLTGGPTARNTVLFQIWNDNEFPLSSTLTFKCWFDQPLSDVSPVYTESFLENNTPHDPSEFDFDCDGFGEFELGWTRIDSILVSTAGGGVVAVDGALLGALTAGGGTFVDGGRLLWESSATQVNGQFVDYR